MKNQYKVPCFEAVYEIDNLYTAWYKVTLGKSSKSSIRDFQRNIDQNLSSIANDLRNGTYQPGAYNHFLIKDPKERIIAASPVRDRVVHHAIMNLYSENFDRHLIYDSYACRIGKGTHKAVLRAFHFAKSSRYFLKMDVRKYFDSIDHATLKMLLAKIITDEKVLGLFCLIISSAENVCKKGIPIGSLTSQYFANFYLSSFDHYFKEQCRAKHYIRYMDDIIIFSNDRSEIDDLFFRAVDFARKKLELNLKPKICGRVNDGVPFLGFLVKPNGIFLQQKTKKRYKARLAEIEYKRKNQLLSDEEASSRIEAVTAHLLIAQSRNFRNNVLHRCFFGDEPRESRGELEQQCREFAFCPAE